MIRLKPMIQTEFVEGFDLEKFLMMTSFAEKVRYANEKLQRIASGSARIIYKIDDKKVLKLAKNAKGIAQNEVESDGFINSAYGDIIAKVLEEDKDARWIVSEYAKKITPSRFKQLLGASISDFYKYLYMRMNRNKRSKELTFHIQYDIPKEVKEHLDNTDFFNELLDMMVNFDMPVGDFGRISTFGEIDGRLVITDYGLTQDVYKTHYERKPEKQY